MPPNKAEVPHVRFPSRTAPDRDTAERQLGLLTNWSIGSFATAIVMARLLPFGIAWASAT